MVIPVSLVAQFIGMFVAAKVLQLNVKFLGIALLTFIPIGLSHIVPGLAGVGLALLSLVILVKAFDGTASFIKIISILLISGAIQAVIFKYGVAPSVEHVLKNAESITIEDGRMAVE